MSPFSDLSCPDSSSLTSSQEKARVFHCSQCGECCSSVSVPIEIKKAQYLATQPWVQQRFEALLPEGGATHFKTHFKTHSMIPLRDDGYCVFLGERNQCLIEEKEGLEQKPTECQRYPFGSVRSLNLNSTESGLSDEKQTLAFDMTVACQTISSGVMEGQLRWRPSAPEWYEALAEQEEVEVLPTRIKVSRFTSISQETYVRWVDGLHEFVRPTEFGRVTSSWGVLLFAKRSLELLVQDKTADVRGLYPKAKSDGDTLSLKGSSSIGDRFWAVMLLRRPYGLLSRWAILTEGNYLDVNVFGPNPIRLKEASSCHGDITWPEEMDEKVARFLVVLLSRRLLLAFGHRLNGLLAMAIGARALVHWYGRTLALIQSKASVDVGDVQGALRLVERYYTGHQPMFPETFRWRVGWGVLAKWMLR